MGAINEAEWKAAQPSINKQVNTAINNIWGDDGSSTTQPAQTAIKVDVGSPQLQVSDLDMPLAPISLVNAAGEEAGTTADSAPATDSIMIDGRWVHPVVTVEPLTQVSMDGDPMYAWKKAYRESYYANALAKNEGIGDTYESSGYTTAAQSYQQEEALLDYYDRLDGANEQVLAELPYEVGKGMVKTAINGSAALLQNVWNGMKEYGAADLDYAAASAAITGDDDAAARLSGAADADRASALQPAWVPFTSLSPGEQLGGYSLDAMGVLAGGVEDVGLLRSAYGMDERLSLSAFGEVSNAGADAADNSDQFVTLFRGDRPGTTVIKSPAAQVGGYAESQSLIDEGNLDDLFSAHAADSWNPPSPFISLTSDRQVAEYFAGPDGVVNEFSIPLSRATPNAFNNFVVPAGPDSSLIPEAEYLVPNYIRPSEFVTQPPGSR